MKIDFASIHRQRQEHIGETLHDLLTSRLEMERQQKSYPLSHNLDITDCTFADIERTNDRLNSFRREFYANGSINNADRAQEMMIRAAEDLREISNAEGAARARIDQILTDIEAYQTRPAAANANTDNRLMESLKVIQFELGPMSNLDEACRDVKDRLDRNINTFLLWTSNAVDNHYDFIASLYAVKVELDLNVKKNIQEALRPINPKLRNHLRNAFTFSQTMREFYATRNAVIHDIPNYTLRLNMEEGSDRLVTLNFNQGTEERPVYSTMLKFWDAIAQNMAQSYRLIK